jgi:Translation initiation factor IF-2, N-terminal region
MENEYMKRGYLLPEGCKDLIDVLKAKGPESLPQTTATPWPQSAGEVKVVAKMTVGELAAALAQKPVQILRDLMELDVFASPKSQIDFETIGKVVRKYGFTAMRA